MSIILALVVFSVLVLFHEFGHFLLAKKNGIGVTEFSLGLGPRILSFEKGGTKYSWKLIPFGGSCAMVGEDSEEEGENSFNSKSVWARISVVAAGPIFNFILAFILAVIVIAMQGYDECKVVSVGNTESFMGAYFVSDERECEVLAVAKDSMAYHAGFVEGDIIKNMNGTRIENGLSLRNALKEDLSDTETIVFDILRDGNPKTIEYKTDDETTEFVFKPSIETSAYQAGLRYGDVITEYDGENIVIGRDLWLYQYMYDVTEKEIPVTYERDGKEYDTVLIPQVRYSMGISYNATNEPCIVRGISEGSAAEKAGIRVDDVIVSIRGEEVSSGEDMKNILENSPLDAGTIEIVYQRDGKEETVTLTPKELYSVGFNFSTGYSKKGTPLQVIRYSFTELRYNVECTLKSFYMLFTGKVSTNDVSGPVGLVSIVGDAYDQSKSIGYRAVFINIAYLVILFSVNLGVLNLFPLPALDGGRLVFLFIEAVRGKPVPRDKEAIVHFVGMILLMILMVLILFNDIGKLI